MAFVQAGDVANVPEEKIMPTNSQVEVEIRKCELVVAKETGRNGIMAVLKVLGEGDVQAIFHRVWFGRDGDDPDKANVMLRMEKSFYEAFGIELVNGGFDTDDVVGLTSVVVLKEVSDDFGDRNEVKKFMASKAA